MSAADCQNIPIPSWMNCSNGSHSPSCSPLPFECYGYQNPQTGDQIGVCAPATYNDSSIGADGRRKDSKGCPATFSAVYSRVTVNGMGDDYCGSDSDCQTGNDAGRCATDLTTTLQDGGHPKACLCTVGSAVEQCPNTPDGGVFSFCRYGNAGDTQACMHTVSCFAPNAYIFRDGGPPFEGCGL
jgi:hypothetical protein